VTYAFQAPASGRDGAAAALPASPARVMRSVAMACAGVAKRSNKAATSAREATKQKGREKEREKGREGERERERERAQRESKREHRPPKPGKGSKPATLACCPS
jgi:hypothetical protein